MYWLEKLKTKLSSLFKMKEVVTKQPSFVTTQPVPATRVTPPVVSLSLTEFKLCHGSKVMEICDRFNWSVSHADWLMACMSFETGGTFKANEKNLAGSGATGLIQFMPSTAKWLGTSTQKLSKMSNIEQLVYVEKYFKTYHRKIKTFGDMYMAILLPKFIGKPYNAVLFSDGIRYRLNSGLDINKDGKVTKKEALQKVLAHLRRGRSNANSRLIYIKDKK